MQLYWTGKELLEWILAAAWAGCCMQPRRQPFPLYLMDGEKPLESDRRGAWVPKEGENWRNQGRNCVTNSQKYFIILTTDTAPPVQSSQRISSKTSRRMYKNTQTYWALRRKYGCLGKNSGREIFPIFSLVPLLCI